MLLYFDILQKYDSIAVSSVKFFCKKIQFSFTPKNSPALPQGSLLYSLFSSFTRSIMLKS